MTPRPTSYDDINALLDDLLSGMQRILGEKLLGMYLYGSLVWGDFDHDISDIDMLAALESDLDDAEFDAIQHMHDTFAAAHPHWENRIEVQYASAEGLRSFRTKASPMANISPGEPFHRITAGREWLMNWYFVQDYGVTLYGPPPSTLIAPVSKAEFIAAVREHAADWREHVNQTKESPPYQAYAILTMCRALYTLHTGKQVSKARAAAWAAEHIPEWADLIRNALRWRSDPANNRATFAETVAFVHAMIDRINAEPPLEG